MIKCGDSGTELLKYFIFMSISTNIAYSVICKLSLLCHTVHNIVIKLVKLILDLDQYILYNYTIHFREYFFYSQIQINNVVLFKKLNLSSILVKTIIIWIQIFVDSRFGRWLRSYSNNCCDNLWHLLYF